MGPLETGYLATVTSPRGTSDGFLDRLEFSALVRASSYVGAHN